MNPDYKEKSMQPSTVGIELLTDEEIDVLDESIITPVEKMDRELRRNAAELTKAGTRELVRSYYQQQNTRIRNGHRLRRAQESGEYGAASLMAYMFNQSKVLQDQAAAAIGIWAKHDPVATWAMGNKGVGPIFAACFSAFLDVNVGEHPSSFMRFCGQDKTAVWKTKELRPFSAFMKRTCYLLAVSFVKSGIRSQREEPFTGPDGRTKKGAIILGPDGLPMTWAIEGAFYASIHLERKRFLTKKNLDGGFQKLAEKKLAEPWAQKVLLSIRGTTVSPQELMDDDLGAEEVDEEGEDRHVPAGESEKKKMVAIFASGRVMAGMVEAMARNHTIRLWLSHLHQVMSFYEHGAIPSAKDTYAHGILGHAPSTWVHIPNWPPQ